MSGLHARRFLPLALMESLRRRSQSRLRADRCENHNGFPLPRRPIDFASFPLSPLPHSQCLALSAGTRTIHTGITISSSSPNCEVELLTRLDVSQRATVLQLPATPMTEAEHDEQRGAEYAG
jgi:hypothetical protein